MPLGIEWNLFKKCISYFKDFLLKTERFTRKYSNSVNFWDRKCSFIFKMDQNFARNGLVTLSVCKSGTFVHSPYRVSHQSPVGGGKVVDDAIFPVVSGKIIYLKMRFPRNLKYYPTLELPPPLCLIVLHSSVVFDTFLIIQ